MSVENKLTVQEVSRSNDTVKPDAAKIMFDALVKIAHSDGFFESEKRLIKIAQKAIEKVTNVE
jgi:hypothetical protein